MRIREETEIDQPVVYAINAAAFPSEAEAKLVDRLRQHASPLISLVAEDGAEVRGHILFTPVSLGSHPELRIMGLAPMAITPEYQAQGLGSALVKAGLEKCNEMKIGAVVVLGHPEFYPRFGFRPAAEFDIHSEYEVPVENFMVLELDEGYLKKYQGCIQYHEEFGKL